MSEHERDVYLKSIYYDAKKIGSYGGLKRLYNAVKRDDKFKFTKAQIRTWLSNQDNYSLQKPVRYKFPRSRIITTGIDYMWDTDLAEFQLVATANDGVRYLLIVIDLFSRFLWIEPLKTKKAKDVVIGMKNIFSGDRKPRKLRSDQGLEFNNTDMKRYMSEIGVQHFHTQNEVKANYAERVIRTMKNHIYRMMNSNNSDRYIDQLDNLVHNYNHSAHRSLRDRTPASINSSNEVKVWREIYFDKPVGKQVIGVRKFRFQVGDTVRIADTRRTFSKDTHHRWTIELFKVTRRGRIQNIPIYHLSDMLAERVQGTFYTSELQHVNKAEDSEYHVERVLKKFRIRGGGG
jgi:transposase InsO family protein